MVRTRKEGGFTLTELLIVMSVIALLAAVVVPTAMRVPAYARSMQCKANLHAISQAYAMRKSAEGWREFTSQLIVDRWQVEFRPYLGKNAEAYLCPEETRELQFSLPKATMTIYNGSTLLYELELFQAAPLWEEGDHNDFLPDKPGLWRVNDDVYSSGNLDRYNMPRYTPGSDPNVSWWVIEDQRYGPENEYATGDQDFNDLNIKLTDLGGGEYRVEGAHGDAGFNFGIKDDLGDEFRESGGALEMLTLWGEGGSYGVNWAVSKFDVSTDRILAMDYEDTRIYAGSDVPPDMENWEENINAPHLGKVNVVMTTGQTVSMRPEEIDPHDPDVNKTLWAPTRATVP
ncbi:MAG: type II secretion system protein [Planctomycetota bacterium]|jgi:prepilin-type N-terminal cleavage/methylation domain-containing protein